MNQPAIAVQTTVITVTGVNVVDGQDTVVATQFIEMTHNMGATENQVCMAAIDLVRKSGGIVVIKDGSVQFYSILSFTRLDLKANRVSLATSTAMKH